MSARGTSSAYDTLFSGCVRGPSERDGKICPPDLTGDPIIPGNDVLNAMVQIGEMADAIDRFDKDGFLKSAMSYIVATVRGEFDPDNGVTLRIPDPDNEFHLTTGEVLELVQDCFYRPPANLEIKVSRVRFGFQVIISLSP